MIRALLATALILAGFCNAQSTDNLPYTLSIEKGKTGNAERGHYYEVPVTLTNTAKDTVYYLSWSCSQDLYSTNHTGITAEQIPCDKNIVIRLALPPGKSRTVDLKFLIKDENDTKPPSFKVGFNLIIVPGDDSIFKKWQEYKKVKNIIWSNEITTELK